MKEPQITIEQLGFSATTLGALTKAGWAPGRCVETNPFWQTLRTAGYTYLEAVDKFLAEFGGLNIVYTTLVGQPRSQNIDVRPHDPALYKDYLFNVTLDGQEINQKLCLFGFLDYDLPLMMAEDGAVYTSFDYGALFIAASGAQAIENIIVDSNEMKIMRQS